jgi:hypothetical protein
MYKGGSQKGAVTGGGWKFLVVFTTFIFLIAVAGLILGSISVSENIKDDDGDVSYTKTTYTGHYDSTLNETLKAFFYVDEGGVVTYSVEYWNGTCIPGGGVYLTSSFIIDDKYLPAGYNASTSEAFITPVTPVIVTSGAYRTVGYAFINPTGHLSVFRDATNSSATWSLANVNCQIKPFSASYPRKTINLN